VTYKKKLIEVALPLVEISAGGATEQSIKRGKPTQIHKWFAARPMVTCRSMLWASLIDDPSEHPELFPSNEDQELERRRLFEILIRLSDWKSSDDVDLISSAQDEIRRSFPDGPPPVVDPFGGGGTIPLEAIRLGLDSIAGDLNPVPVLIQKGLLEFPIRFSGSGPVHPSADDVLMVGANSGLAEDVERYGQDIRRDLNERYGHLFPSPVHPERGEVPPVAWVWARTVKSPDPSFNGHVPLVKSWLLMNSEKHGKCWVEPVVDREESTVTYVIRTEGEIPEPTAPSRGSGRCVATGCAIDPDYVKEQALSGKLGVALIAVVGDGVPGRLFCEPLDSDRLAAETGLPEWIPSGPMSDHPQYMAPPRYGMDDWWKLFSERQLTINVALSEAVRDIHPTIVTDAVSKGLADDSVPFHEGGRGARAYADVVVTYLSFVVDRVVDWNNSCCGWDNKNLVNQHLFTRQAIPMMWDYCEIPALGDGAGSFGASLKTIRNSIDAIPSFSVGGATVTQIDARALVASLNDVIVSTDPPYYDVVPYADISDFFYMWLRHMVGDIWPNLFSTLATPKAEELVADSRRNGSKDSAKSFFENGMLEFMKAVSSAQIEDVPASIFYAYKANEVSKGGKITSSGWDSFLQSIVDAGLVITSTWPVRTENKSRLRALKSNALASSVVLTCRRRSPDAPLGTRKDFLSSLKSELPSHVFRLQSYGIPAVDLAQAAIGPGVEIFSRFGRVVESDGSRMSIREALSVINEVLAEIIEGEESELDSESRFALTWFETYGFNPSDFGSADSLARAKNTTVSGVVEAGIGESRAGRFRLLDRNDLSDDWDPISDSRLTIWEIVQRLVKALDASEVDAASLMSRIGSGLSERAKHLGYMLFLLSEKSGRNDEASLYNGLITAWPEIERLAEAGPIDEPAIDDRLF
jgi:putative DNA methylase